MTFGDRRTPLKRTALNRGTTQMKRTEMRKMSKKAAASQRRNSGWRAELVKQPCALRPTVIELQDQAHLLVGRMIEHAKASMASSS
jgi:hypothetical protein